MSYGRTTIRHPGPLPLSTWPLSVVSGVVVTATILTDTWLYLLGAIPGITFVAFAALHPRVGLFLWLLAAPAANAYAVVTMPPGVPDITFQRVAITVVIGGLLLQKSLAGRRLVPLSGTEYAMIALLVVMSLDLLTRSSGGLASNALQNFDERVTPVLFFLAARNLCVDERDLKGTLYALLALTAYLVVHGVYQYLTYSPASLAGLDREQVLEMGHLARGRAVGPFVNGIEYGSVVACGFLSALILGLYLNGGLSRLVMLASLLPAGAAVVLSATRAVWLGAYLAVPTVGWLSSRRPHGFLFLVGAGTVLLLSAAVLLPEESFMRQRATETGPVQSRLVMYRIAARMAVRQPLIGYGRGAGSRVAARRELNAMGDSRADVAPGQFHNVFVMHLMEWGTIGLTAYLAIFVMFVRAALALRRRTASERSTAYHFAGFFIAVTIVYVVQGVFADVTAFLYLTSLLFFLAGLVHAQLDVAGSSDPELPSPLASF